MYINPLRKKQFIGLFIGLGAALLVTVYLSLPVAESMSSLGPMNTGHEGLNCNECHTKARGTLGQQLQTNFMYMVGMRKTGVDFGLENVDNNKCEACHDRPNDRHPVHRFLEPRFAEARKRIAPTECESCHREHSGRRVTTPNFAFCVNCHQDTEIKNDPLDVSHAKLIENENWTSCLQCHDFHGNHTMKTPHQMSDTISIKAIEEYMNGGISPYSDEKKHLAKKTIYPNKKE